MVAVKYNSNNDDDINSKSDEGSNNRDNITNENGSNYLKNSSNHKSSNKKHNKNGKNDKHGRIIKQSLYPNTRSNKYNLLLGVFSSISFLLIILLGYFVWFFQNQNDNLRKKIDVVQNQLKFDLKNNLSSISSFEKEIKSSFENFNLNINKKINKYQKQNNDFYTLAKENSNRINDQQKILNSPNEVLSSIKNNAHNLMLASLINNINQALSINNLTLSRELWIENTSWLYENFITKKNQLDKINNIFSSLLIPNDAQMLEVLSSLNSKIKYLKIIDINSRYKSKLNIATQKNQDKDNNLKEKSSWFTRQKLNSEKYIASIWKSITGSFVISDNKKSPLLVTQGDRVDAYRIIKQLVIQMQWSIISNNSKLFILSKNDLIEFINNNFIDDSYKRHWILDLRGINLPDQTSEIEDLKKSLLSL